MKKRISQLKVGDLVDLKGDRYADNGQHPEFEFEYSEVGSIEVESPTCTRVDFSNMSCGFPPDHEVETLDRSGK